MQTVDRARGGEAPAQPPPDARQVAPGELRLAQAERLDEQHAVLECETGHEVMLVGPQLGVPVGEPDAHYVAALKAWGIAHRRHDLRLGSLVTVIHGDEARTARLVFDAELTAGALAPEALNTRSVRAATRVRAVPPRVLRVAGQVRYTLVAWGQAVEAARPEEETRREGTGLRYVKARLEESFPGRWTMAAGPVEGGWRTVIELGGPRPEGGPS